MKEGTYRICSIENNKILLVNPSNEYIELTIGALPESCKYSDIQCNGEPLFETNEEKCLISLSQADKILIPKTINNIRKKDFVILKSLIIK